MSESNVTLTLVLGEAGDDAPVRSRPRKAGYCGHRRVELDGTARRVYCRDCGDEVDAWETLSMLAAEPERWERHRETARADAKRAQAELDDLKRRVRNAKAQLRRAER